MTAYESGLPVAVAFPPEEARSLADAWSEAGLRQLHLAETEKYAHVTYFFNGGVEPPHPGEDRRLIPSPHVATYDLEPAMSAVAITDALVDAIRAGTWDVIVTNYANPDMVAHTGNWEATIAALEVIDACLARVARAMEEMDAAHPDAPGGVLAITADHGNADELRTVAGLRDGPLAESRAVPPGGPRGRNLASRGRRSRGRGSDPPRAPGPAGVARDHGPLAPVAP